MSNGSTSTNSLLGSLLSMAPPASSTAVQKVASARQQSQDTASFTDTLTGVRQEVARARPAARRSAELRPAQDHRSAPAPSADRSKPESQQVHKQATAKNSVNAAAPDQKQLAGAGRIDSQQPDTTESRDNISTSSNLQELRNPDEELFGLPAAPLESINRDTSVEVSPAIGMPSDQATEIPVEEMPVATENIDVELPVAGETGLPEDAATEPAMILDGIIPPAGDALAGKPAPGVSQSVGSSEKSLSAGENVPVQPAETKVALPGGNIDAAMSGEGEAKGEGNAKESFAKLLATSTAETKPLAREPAATSSAVPANEAAARALESLTPAGRSFVVQSGVANTVGHPQWSQAVGDRVLWLAAQNITSAELRLDPPELGPMQVRVTVQHEQVQVTFSSPHAAVREALDQGATRLREMFNEQGLNLNVDVSDQSLSRRQEGEDSPRGRRNGEADLSAEEAVVAEVAIQQMRLVDHYA